MSIVGNQRRVLRQLLAALRPHWRTDPALPGRIERLLRGDRRLGSRDRRLYRELIYALLRHLPWVEPLLDADPDRAEETLAWLAADTPATAAFRAALLERWPPCPATVGARAAFLGTDPDAILPGWLRAECPGAFRPEERDALCARAPLWVRLQTDDPEPVLAEFRARGWQWMACPGLPDAIRLPAEADVTSTAAFRDGRLEIQDAGSQSILAAANIPAGGRWLDACAGAGGKTLQLARLLGPAGRVDAADIRPAALDELSRRAARSGLAARIAIPASLEPAYDGVLVDAPCSGTGTWRRQPHLKWSTDPASIARQARRQSELLGAGAARVGPGGRLIYATCSLCRTENEEVVRAFLEKQPEFSPAPPDRILTGAAGDRGGIRFWPTGHDGDGFFASYLLRSP